MLPERPSLEQLKKQAKELRSGGGCATLAEAQREIAKRHGFASWPKLKLAVESARLRRLIEQGDAAGARALLSSSPALARMRFEDGSTPLHVAAGENRPALIEMLVQHGARPGARWSRTAHSALSWAVTCWAYDAGLRLVELGTEPDLFCAAGLGLLDRVRSSWPAGRLLPRPSTTGSTRYTEDGRPLPCPPRRAIDQVSDALYIACHTERLEVARFLLDRGADPNWRGYAGATCLAWAEFTGNAELAALVRERGGSDEIQDHRYRAVPRAFPMFVFAGWGFPRLLIDRLARDPTLVALASGRGTLLHAAAEGGQVGTARILLRFGADRAALDPEGRTPADLAAIHGHAEVARELG